MISDGWDPDEAVSEVMTIVTWGRPAAGQTAPADTQKKFTSEPR